MLEVLVCVMCFVSGFLFGYYVLDPLILRHTKERP